jgi:2-dehydro-3-deoxyphosphogluconate aldolase/(4S)-4-hydroxy-2-oxoglutarate aldolase
MHAVLEELGKIGIVPVIKIDDAVSAVPLAKALIAGGIPCAEITFRTSCGEEAIRRINREVPEMLLGAGTVLNTEQVDRAVDAGAKFIVTPGLNPRVVAHCIKKGIPVTPGCSTPSDMDIALEAGLDVVKFFPAEQAGGLAYIKAVAAPYSSLKFMPTGGINTGNLAEYLGYEKILACGGSWMVGADLINAGKFDTVTALCKEAVARALGFAVAHIGVNEKSETEALNAAKMFETLFGFTPKSGPGGISVFAGDNIEISNSPFPGAHGHIGIGVAGGIERAVYHLEGRGFTFDHKNARRDAKGALRVIYFTREIAGFAIHLTGK